MLNKIFPYVIFWIVTCSVFTACDSSDENSPKPMVYELQATDENGIDIAIQAGDILHITVTGTVNTNPDGLVEDCDKWTDADGIPDCQYVTDNVNCRGLPFMALIGFWDNQYFLVGTDYRHTFQTNGSLTLLINDWVYIDNDGKFTISVYTE